MSKAAFWIWLHVSLVLAGVFVTVLLLAPSLQPLSKAWFFVAAAAAMLVAAPLTSMLRKAFS